MSDHTRAWVDGLRKLADFVEKHPTLGEELSAVSILVYACTSEEFIQLAKELGSGEKVSEDSWYTLRRRFGPHRFELFTDRNEVCERVLVGTQTVLKPVYEWHCPDSILA
jgi:hypothetical protein